MAKVCIKCKETKDHEEFAKHPSTSDGRDTACKLCKAAYVRQRYAENYIPADRSAPRCKRGTDLYKPEQIIVLMLSGKPLNTAAKQWVRVYKEVSPHFEVAYEMAKMATRAYDALMEIEDRQLYGRLVAKAHELAKLSNER